MSTSNWFLLSVLSLLWGGSFFLNELAIPLGSTSLVVLCRVAIGSLGIWFLVWWKGISVPLGWRIWLGFLLMGLLCNVIPFMLFVQAQRTLDSGITATLNATTPLFTALIAHGFIDDERLKRRVFMALAIAAGGVWVLSGSPNLQGGSQGAFTLPMAAAVCHGIAAVFARRIMVRVAPEIAAAGVLTCATLVSAILVYLQGGWQSAQWALQPILAVVVLGVFSTAVAYLLYFRLLNRVGATALSLVTVLMPISAMVLGVVFLRESIDQRSMLGLGLILCSLVVFNGWFSLRLPRLYFRRQRYIPSPGEVKHRDHRLL